MLSGLTFEEKHSPDTPDLWEFEPQGRRKTSRRERAVGSHDCGREVCPGGYTWFLGQGGRRQSLCQPEEEVFVMAERSSFWTCQSPNHESCLHSDTGKTRGCLYLFTVWQSAMKLYPKYKLNLWSTSSEQKRMEQTSPSLRPLHNPTAPTRQVHGPFSHRLTLWARCWVSHVSRLSPCITFLHVCVSGLLWKPRDQICMRGWVLPLIRYFWKSHLLP